MQDDLLNAHFTTKGVRSLGSLNNCVVLWRISCILEHDFFRDLSDSIDVRVSLSVSK